MLELWASSLRDAKAQIAPLFTQARVAASAGLFLAGLLGDERRKTSWMRAEAASDPGTWRQLALLGHGRWDADALRDMVRADTVFVMDETGCLKQGKASCGVGRQYTGSAGKITNCQIGVFTALYLRAVAMPSSTGALSTQGLDGRRGSHGGSPCADADRLFDQTCPRPC